MLHESLQLEQIKKRNSFKTYVLDSIAAMSLAAPYRDATRRKTIRDNRQPMQNIRTGTKLMYKNRVRPGRKKHPKIADFSSS